MRYRVLTWQSRRSRNRTDPSQAPGRYTRRALVPMDMATGRAWQTHLIPVTDRALSPRTQESWQPH